MDPGCSAPKASILSSPETVSPGSKMASTREIFFSEASLFDFQVFDSPVDFFPIRLFLILPCFSVVEQ